MKGIKLLLVGIIFIAFGCSEPLLNEELEPTPELKCGVNNPLEFEAAFWTVEVYRSDMYPWGDPGWWAFDNVTEGFGIAKHLGKTKVIKTMNVIGFDHIYPFILNGHAAYISANKDTLMFRISSEIYADPELGWPHTMSKNFQAEFLYGTGRFAKAADGEITVVDREWNDETREGTLTERVIIYF